MSDAPVTKTELKLEDALAAMESRLMRVIDEAFAHLAKVVIEGIRAEVARRTSVDPVLGYRPGFERVGRSQGIRDE